MIRLRFFDKYTIIRAINLQQHPDILISSGGALVKQDMLKLCGMGIAMGNAVQEVKDIADKVIGTNDDEGIADYLIEEFNL